jgi:sugar phosphate isomerase/epimerase
MNSIAWSTISFVQLRTPKNFVGTLDAIKDASYAGVAIEYPLLSPSLKENPREVAKLVKAARLELVAVAVSLSPATVRFAQKVDGKLGTLCLFEKGFDVAVAKSRKLLKISSELGITIALHPHVRSNVESSSQVSEFLNRCKPFSPTICFDSAHFPALGIDVENFVRRFAGKISVAHLKDLREAKPAPDIVYEKDFVDIGDGVVDFRKTLSALKKSYYSGWLIVEVDYPQEETAAVSVKKNYERLTHLLLNIS